MRFKYLTVMSTRQAIEALPSLAPMIDIGRNRYILIQQVTLSLYRNLFYDMAEKLTPKGGRHRIMNIDAKEENGDMLKFLVGFIESEYDARGVL